MVGLGNPGPRYARTRHNVGFMAAEEFLRRHGVGAAWEEHGALVRAARWAGERLLVVRPLEFMNLSGGPISALCRSEGAAPADLVLAYDDADLPFGSIRVRPGGRPAGHKGVASIVEALGTDEIPRVRIGVGRPPEVGDLAEWVLETFDPAEAETLPDLIGRAVDAAELLIREGVKSAMNRYNRRDDEGDP